MFSFIFNEFFCVVTIQLYTQKYTCYYYLTQYISCSLAQRRVLSSIAPILGSSVQIPREAWLYDSVYSVFVLSYIGRNLAKGRSTFQRVLPNAYKILGSAVSSEPQAARGPNPQNGVTISNKWTPIN
jgi:hypothetical protein